MNNLSIKLKKMLSNKNVVTVLCFLAIAVVLIVGYNYRIKQETTPINVPYAKTTIEPQQEINESMIGYKPVASNAIDKKLIYTNAKDIIDMYTKLNSTIYEGSFFYKEAIDKKENVPSSVLMNVEEGNTLLSLRVNMETSLFNSFVPGDYFDLYVRTIGKLDSKENVSDEIIVGKLLTAVKILAVKTENGENVFGGEETKTPAGILFAVPDEYALLIMKADYFSKLSQKLTIEFVAVPRGKSYETDDGEEIKTIISSEKLEKYIKDKTADIDIKDIKKNVEIGE